MGHYDSCYEADNEEHRRRLEGWSMEEFDNTLKNVQLTTDERNFLTHVIKNISNYMTFFEILNLKERK